MPPSLLPPRPHRHLITNRVRAFMVHIPWFTIEGQVRLARECGISPTTVSRLVRHTQMPSFYIAEVVTRALEKRLKRELPMREVFSTDGTFPTSCVCDLVPWCTGCFPPDAFDDEENLRPEYRDLRPGDWCRFSTSKRDVYPQQTSPVTK